MMIAAGHSLGGASVTGKKWLEIEITNFGFKNRGIQQRYLKIQIGGVPKGDVIR